MRRGWMVVIVAVGGMVGCGDDGPILVDAAVAGEEWGVATADFGPGAAYAHVFDEPGTDRFYCSLHGIADFGMTGEIVVEPADE